MYYLNNRRKLLLLYEIKFKRLESSFHSVKQKLPKNSHCEEKPEPYKSDFIYQNY